MSEGPDDNHSDVPGSVAGAAPAAATPQPATVASAIGHAPTMAAAPVDAAITLAIGQRVGDRYVVRAFLGEGGMGAVYRALDEELDEEVALKVVRAGKGTGESLRDEVRLAQKVTHHNVCRTYDLEDIGDLLCVKMEYVSGDTLSARLAKLGRLPIAEAIRIGRAIAAGLAAAHACGIIHRDLKPGNVMLAEDGRVVLMDWGLAHRVARGDASVAGTPGYMAPEQIVGMEVDARTDYYALGCVVHEMLTGKRVFGGGRTNEINDRHMDAPPPNARTLRGDVPRWLARATLSLLAKDKPDRTAGFALLVSGPRRRWLVAPIAVVALAGVAIAAIAIVHEPAPWRPAIRDLLPDEEESSDGASISPDGTAIVFNSDRGNRGRFRLYRIPITGGDAELLTPDDESYDEPRWTRDGHGLLTAIGTDRMVRFPLDHAPVVELGRGNNPDDCGDAIAFVETNWNGFRLMLRTADGVRHELLRATADEVIERPRCDPSGQHVVFVRGMTQSSAFGDDVFVSDRAGVLTQLTTDHTAGAAAFTPDGTSIVFSSKQDGRVQIYEVAATGGPVHRITYDDGPDSAPDVSRDGTAVVITREVNLFKILGLGTGRDPIREITSRRESLYNLRVASRGGETLIGERADGSGDSVVVVDTKTGTERTLTRGYLPFVSLDGGTIYFRAPEHPQRLQRIALAGGSIATVAELPGRIVVGFDAPDGPHVELDRDHHIESWHVAADGRITGDGVEGVVVPAATGGWRYVAKPEGDHFQIRILSPTDPLDAPGRAISAASWVNTWLDDHRFAYGDGDAFHILDVTTGTEVGTVAAPGHAGVLAVLAADGVHWFDSQSQSRVTRHLVTGFADRPWR